MRSPGIVAVAASVVAVVIAALAPSLIDWGQTIQWWVRVPVVSVVLTIMLGASVAAGIAFQDLRIQRTVQQLPQNGKAD